MRHSNECIKNLSPEKPLISIITVVYNGEKYLEQTIQSVLQQTYSSIEYIIIDGGSTDNTVNIIKKYEKKITYWISEEDKGIYDAWNKGIALTKGEWITFVGSDDILLPDAMESYISFYQHNYPSESIEFISSKIQLVNNDLSLKRLYGSAWNWKQFRKFMNVAHPGALHHKNLFQQYGLYDITYKIAADYEFLLRANKNLKAVFLDKVTLKMRNESGISVKGNSTQYETKLAKITTAGRNKILANYEMVIAISKMQIRKLLKL